MLLVISYDITDDNKRNHLAKKLRDFGRRVQKSVFEADVTDKELKQLDKVLTEFKLADAESIRLYRICQACKGLIKIWGTGTVTEDEDYYIV